MTDFVVTQECLDLGLRARTLLIHDLKIESASDELRAAIDEEVARVGHEFDSLAELRAIPELVAAREIIRAVGVKPKSHPPSTQKLLEYAWKRKTLPSINNLVDAYNLMSLRTRCSLGAHDLGLIKLPIELRLFDGTEPFRPLRGDAEQPANQGEFGYVDAAGGVLCRLDSLQADFSKVTEQTSDAILIVESTTTHSSDQLDNALSATAAAITRYCHPANVQQRKESR